jgi:hypothetical protein
VDAFNLASDSYARGQADLLDSLIQSFSQIADLSGVETDYPTVIAMLQATRAQFGSARRATEAV